MKARGIERHQVTSLDNKYIWKNPHPFIFNTSSIILPGLLTFVIIFMLAPFDISDASIYIRVIHAFASAFIASGCVWLVVSAIKILFPRWTRNENWTIGKEMILFISVISAIAFFHFLLYFFQFSEEPPLLLFQKVYLRTIVVSIFPVIGLVLFEQYNHRTKQLKRALILNKAIRNLHVKKRVASNISGPDKDRVWFLHENDKPACQINIFDIQFIKADGNYFNIYYLDSGKKLASQLVRNKLSYAESLLNRDYFWRVHRSFIVNLNQIETASGNARDFTLIMKNSEQCVPVSRSKINSLLETISSHSHSPQYPPIHTK